MPQKIFLLKLSVVSWLANTHTMAKKHENPEMEIKKTF